ncbi:flavodoxin domain-containing protein [Solibacillus sp. FSL H8-0523]|uniref:flavodoxin domain-containing protein n=1 Tax=Solibacillus sp. FSL H8-0523 TaxID=2954511 RepID=UPI003100F3C6
MQILIVCDSMTGNTQMVAEFIQKTLWEQHEYHAQIASPKENVSIEGYDLVFLGAYTWGEGKLPKKMRDYLANILVENELPIFPQFSVFGTGDTQWGGENLVNYCRAVDAMYYYCSKYANEPIAKLKIEQSPVSKFQQNEIFKFINETLRGMIVC